MDVIVHQHVGVEMAAGMQQGFTQELQVSTSVVVIKKAREPIVSSLHDVLGDMR
jgi:hypothetical protein